MQMLRFVKEKFLKGKTMIRSLGVSAFALLASATSALAANEDLETVTSTLTEGAGDIKTNFLSMMVVVIPIIIVAFGIFWLIVRFRSGMNKA